MFLARVAHGHRLDLTLPPAASSGSRFVTIRRLDSRGAVHVRADAGRIEGVGVIASGYWHAGDEIKLEGGGDYVTLVSDGSAWYVFAAQR